MTRWARNYFLNRPLLAVMNQDSTKTNRAIRGPADGTVVLDGSITALFCAYGEGAGILRRRQARRSRGGRRSSQRLLESIPRRPENCSDRR